MRRHVIVQGRTIGPGHPPYIVAEMSGNHNGDFDRAVRLLEAAKKAGADAVKLQTYTADTLTIDHDGPGFRVEGGLWDGKTLYELYEQAHTPWEWHKKLFEKGRELGLAVFSSPFDETAVDFLAELDAPAYKIASFEVVDLPLIRSAASKGKPLIISTGMANLAEIEEAVHAAHEAGCDEIVLLHCVSGYPTLAHDANLATIPDLARRFGCPVGLSDHTLGVAVSVAATALGAAMIEKHYTLKRSDGGPDAAFSLEPDELKMLCEGCRTATSALGTMGYERKGSEQGSAIYRRSLYAVADVAKGGAFTKRNVRSIRPGHGLPPKHLPEVLGQRATREVSRGTPMEWSFVEMPERPASVTPSLRSGDESERVAATVSTTSGNATASCPGMRFIDDDEHDQLIKNIEYVGYSVIPSAMSDSLVDELLVRARTLYEVESNKTYTNISENQQLDKYIYNLQYRDKTFIDVISAPQVSRVLMHFLNDRYYFDIPREKPNYILASYNARSSVALLPLHIDSHVPSLGKYPCAMQAIFLLNDQTADNGATIVVPGTHQSGSYTDRELRDYRVLSAKAGDIIIWDSRLWHGALENESGDDLWSLVATLKMWWAKQKVDMPRGLPEDIYTQLTDEQKALLGFCTIPPKDENERISTKLGYSALKLRVSDYFSD